MSSSIRKIICKMMLLVLMGATLGATWLGVKAPVLAAISASGLSSGTQEKRVAVNLDRCDAAG
jgi:hypothetical protein